MFVYIGYWFPIVLVIFLYCLFLYVRPTRIDLTSDSLVVHSAYKDYVYSRRELAYEGNVSKSDWERGLYRTFGIGWPFPCAGRFTNTLFGDFVLVSLKQPDDLQRVVVDGKTLLLQLSAEQIRELSTTRVQV
jgi:hypothetical protein